jgi:6-phosphofructokinase 1
VVNVERYYNTERYRPVFNSFDMAPLFIMTSEG